jgi:hypothetical protein
MEITTTAAMAANTENRFNLNNKRRPNGRLLFICRQSL